MRFLRVFAILASLLIGVEGISFAILSLLAFRDHSRLPTSHMREEYRSQPWGETLWREQKQLAVRPYQSHPYGLWLSAPMSGKTIVVDNTGIRKTAHSSCDDNAQIVYVFGGSNVWGYGAPDWETIPSHLAKLFAVDGRPACVVNFGADSWRADQGVVKLILELKKPKSRHPNAVVFLNGCNDVVTPFFLTGRVDIEWEFRHYESWLNGYGRLRDGSLFYLSATNTASLVKRVIKRFMKRTVHQMPTDSHRLAREIAENYAANIRIVEGLSRSHGFRSVFFWQPSAFLGGKKLTHEEEIGVQDGNQTYPAIRPALELTLSKVRATASDQFQDLTDIFDNHSGSVYIDFCHLLPQGNRIVAERIYKAVK